ncbi:hypothetical protein H5J25_04865 [Sphingomonas aliaeris]|uniref:Uncharacterized protein n=1 Tax=Sphingomonas aliaeris TaxID=2759526 RepID=A0A974S4W9_9SPHN|nr:hypothetical protein [Sphingomonas aliaeris]QQV78073.1 hypothetical protein H5J25_04865 [Sphingomonas aliaeris]
MSIVFTLPVAPSAVPVTVVVVNGCVDETPATLAVPVSAVSTLTTETAAVPLSAAIPVGSEVVETTLSVTGVVAGTTGFDAVSDTAATGAAAVGATTAVPTLVIVPTNLAVFVFANTSLSVGSPEKMLKI